MGLEIALREVDKEIKRLLYKKESWLRKLFSDSRITKGKHLRSRLFFVFSGNTTKESVKIATALSKDVVVIALSKDLPFAQKRFCDSNKIRNIFLFSDYRYSSFGLNYGLLIKEMNLLSRAIVILDKDDIIRYVQVVEEITNPPDYETALKNVESAFNPLRRNPRGFSAEGGSASGGSPGMNAVDSIFASGRKPRTLVRGGFTPYPVKESPGLPDHCQACEGLIKPLPAQRAEELLATYRGWSLSDGKKILKEFKFKDFSEAKYFVDLVSLISEEQGHHPVITLVYNKVKITLTTHAAGGLTDNDFIMARTIDDVVFS